IAQEKSQVGAATGKRGGTITTASQNDWVTFDNVLNTADSTPHYVIYDPLFFFEPDSKGSWGPTPGLVEKWEFSGNTGTFHLRQGVKFHDGSDWKTDVFKWNFERMITDPKSQYKGTILGVGVDEKNPVTIVDDYTAKINLTRPAPSLVETLTDAHSWPISKASFQKMGAASYARNPVGTGPMQFVEWRPSDRIIVKRFANYWQKGDDGQPLPYLDGITYRLIIDDSVRTVEIKAHSVDLTELIPGTDIPGVTADPAINFINGTWCGNCYRLIFNAAGGPFHDNFKLRQAALYAIDRETLAKSLGQGAGVASKFLLLPGSMGYDESLPYYGYDLEKSKSLMQEAGYPKGIDVTFLIIAREIDKLQAEILKQMWAKVGIRASIDAVERAALNQRILTGKGNFDLTSGRYPTYAGDADISMRTFWYSKGSFNKARLNSKDMDTLLDRAVGTYNLDERVSLYHDAQKLDFNLAYYGYLWTQNWNWAINKRIAGFPPAMTSAWDFRPVSVQS
ncbi:MAG TPA: ABC transporter substrate-binding protein, partial [Chloroflexota bacterium]|nr:ABC transporter substrate-binding protein [Chloroflexota bacterium]